MMHPRFRLIGGILLLVFSLSILVLACLFRFTGILPRFPALALIIPALAMVLLSVALVCFSIRENSNGRKKDELRRLEELHSLYRSLHGLRHDLKNHLQVASALIRQGQAQQGSEYLDSLEQDIFSLFSTGCLPLDSALTLKELEMRQRQIRFDHQLCHLDSLPIRDYAFCSIISNLLDNAIEAHDRYRGTEPYTIELHIRRVRDMLYIECINPADAASLQTAGGRFLSSKKEEGHGLGIANIESIVSRAQGHSTFTCSNGRFTVILALPCNS